MCIEGLSNWLCPSVCLSICLSMATNLPYIHMIYVFTRLSRSLTC